MCVRRNISAKSQDLHHYGSIILNYVDIFSIVKSLQIGMIDGKTGYCDR